MSKPGKGPRDSEDEWPNNFGIVVEDRAHGSIVRRCRDGIGAWPTFNDLTVRIKIDR